MAFCSRALSPRHVSRRVFLHHHKRRFAHLDKKGAPTRSKRALHVTLQGLRGCGVGVIISTALIHLIGEAYEPFEDSGLAEYYDQW